MAHRRLVVLGLLAAVALFRSRVTAGAAVTFFTAPSPIASMSFGLDGTLYYITLPGKLGYLRHDGLAGTIDIPSNHQYCTIRTGPDGSLWLTEGCLGGDQVARYVPSVGFMEYSTPTQGAKPLGIAPGPDGNMWFAESGACQIGRIALDGTITEYPVPAAENGCSLSDVTVGPDGVLWATDLDGRVLRFAGTGNVTSYATPFGTPAGDIHLGPDGALWFVEGAKGARSERVARITIGGSITDYDVGCWCCCGALTLAPDGAFWISDGYFPQLLRITTTGNVTDHSALLKSQATTMVAGRDGALWINSAAPTPIERIGPTVPGDANGDGAADIYDVFYLINFLYAGGPAPAI